MPDNTVGLTPPPPKVHPFAPDLADHLVQVPARRRRGPATLQAPRNLGAELDRPAADRLVADIDPALSQQILDVAKTEREAEIQPHTAWRMTSAGNLCRLNEIGFIKPMLHKAVHDLHTETF